MVTFQTAFQELSAGMPVRRSHALQRDVCALTCIRRASELTAGKGFFQTAEEVTCGNCLLQNPREDQPP